MGHDPLAEVIDEPLTVDAAILEGLREFRAAPKLEALPGVNPVAERERLSNVLNELADRLADGITVNPSKLWVMRHFQHSLKAVQYEDTEGREHFGMELEKLMDILGIDSSDGLLSIVSTSRWLI